ncbi:MAG: ABC transporter ATP-binding protein [Oscillospiraceae bacterium]|nr:ABC transporter ATP-binding protein [Oscillospiraceae bacterium]
MKDKKQAAASTEDLEAQSFFAVRELRRRVKDGTFREILEDWRWIFTYSKRYRWAIVFYTVLGIVSTTLGLVSSLMAKYTLDIIIGHKTSKLWLLFIIMVGSALFSVVFENLLGRISLKIGIRIGNDIRADIFSKIIDSDWSRLNEYQSGDIVNRFSSDTGTVGSNAVSWLPTILISLYRFIATFVVLAHYDLFIACFSLASAPVLMLMSRFVIRKQRYYGKKMREMSSNMMSFEVETFYNLDTIKSFGVTDQYGRKLDDRLEEVKKVTLDYNKFTIHTNIFMSIAGTVVSMTIFGYCLYRLWFGTDFTYGTMTLFLQQSRGLSSAFKSVVGIIPAFLNSSISAHRIRELVELPKEVRLPGSEVFAEKAKDGLRVELTDLSFGYDPEKPVVEHAALTAGPGEIVALVGASGEGKTTMIRLLLALVRPDDGSVRIRAADGAELTLNAETRSLISYVPQGNTILSGTIEENLRMGKEDATDAEMREALELACALEFVDKLPNGLQTVLGRRGKGLSEGQAQRLAIARALLRDAPILLLDEATSSLDVATERRVLRNLMTRTPNKTCIITTHRPSVLNLCTRVYQVTARTVTELDAETSARLAMDF